MDVAPNTTNSADDSDGSDGDDEEQDVNKTHDEVREFKHRLLRCFYLFSL